MPSSDLPQAQAAVLVELFNSAPCGEEAKTFDFSLGGEFEGRMYAAELPLLVSALPGCSLVCTLATHTPHSFMAVTRSRGLQTAMVLGNLEEFQVETGALREGHSMSFPEQDGQSSAHSSVVIAKPSAIPSFEQMPSSIDVEGRHVYFWMVLPCTAHDMQVRKQVSADDFMRYLLVSGVPVFSE
jgi:hypothetical protein